MSMRILPAVVVAALAFPVMTSCAFPPPREGEPCSASPECDERLECVLIDDDAVCLPVIERAPTACVEDEDCRDALFPVEVECDAGACRCLDEVECFEGEFDELLCACVLVESDFCASNADCEDGLNCEDGACSPGDEPGDVCSFNEPCVNGLACECEDGGCAERRCRAPEGVACDAREDCARDASNCVNGACSELSGGDGDTCTAFDDCATFECFDGECF